MRLVDLRPVDDGSLRLPPVCSLKEGKRKVTGGGGLYHPTCTNSLRGMRDRETTSGIPTYEEVVSRAQPLPPIVDPVDRRAARRKQRRPPKEPSSPITAPQSPERRMTRMDSITPLGPGVVDKNDPRVKQRLQALNLRWVEPLSMKQWGTNYQQEGAVLKDLDCPDDDPQWLVDELQVFEEHLAVTNTVRECKTGLPKVSPPPPVAHALFQLMQLKETKMAKYLSQLPQAEIVAATRKWGLAGQKKSMSRPNFIAFLRTLCQDEFDPFVAGKVFDLFDRDHSGDVDTNEVAAGLCLLLEETHPEHTLKYFFGLLDTHRRFPRYITKFEVETLVDAYKSSIQPGQTAAWELAAVLDTCLQQLDYDYCGRTPLTELLRVLREGTSRNLTDVLPKDAYLAIKSLENEADDDDDRGTLTFSGGAFAESHRTSLQEGSSGGTS